MLELLRDLEIGKKQGNDKDVVHREGEFDDVTGDELEGVLPAPTRDHGWGQGQSKKGGEGNPDGGPAQRLFEANNVRFTMKDAEVQRQEKDYHQNEHSPIKQRCFGGSRHCKRLTAGLGAIKCPTSSAQGPMNVRFPMTQRAWDDHLWGFVIGHSLVTAARPCACLPYCFWVAGRSSGRPLLLPSSIRTWEALVLGRSP